MTVFLIPLWSELFSVQEFELLGTSLDLAHVLKDLKGVYSQGRESLYVYLEHVEIVVHMQISFTI